MIMSDKTYNILKEIAQVWLPAIATAYGVIAGIWGIPYETEIPLTIMAIDTMLGTILKISTSGYNSSIKEESEVE